MNLYEQWLEAKEREQQAISDRRAIEDQMNEHFALNDQNEGSQTRNESGFSIKITQRLNKKIDADKLQEIAQEEGLSDHLVHLFRWKPEINKKLWDSADESITRPLAGAITSKPGRPSYSISKEEE